MTVFKLHWASANDPLRPVVFSASGAFFMNETGFPYCIPDKRDLTATESVLMDFLLKQVEGVTIEADELKVVAAVASVQQFCLGNQWMMSR